LRCRREVWMSLKFEKTAATGDVHYAQAGEVVAERAPVEVAATWDPGLEAGIAAARRALLGELKPLTAAEAEEDRIAARRRVDAVIESLEQVQVYELGAGAGAS